MPDITSIPDSELTQYHLQSLPDDQLHAAYQSAPAGGIVGAVENLWNNPPAGPSIVGAVKSAVQAFKTPGEAAQGKFAAPAPETPGMVSDEDVARAQLAAGNEADAASNMANNVALPDIPGIAKPTAAVPTADDLYAAGRQAYKAIKGLGVTINPQPVADLAHSLESELTENGFTDRNVPETYGVREKRCKSRLRRNQIRLVRYSKTV